MEVEQPVHVVLMGVSGSGKTSVASLLHDQLGWPYAEADDFHPEANKAKMAAGHALNDDDRWPWLRTLRDWMSAQAVEKRSSIVTCSALKRSYRDLLREAEGTVLFVHLDGPIELIGERMSHRAGHFMPTSLLPSQFATLEPLEADENGLALNIEASPRDLADQILAVLNLKEI
ncbi:gluconokinase [Corynebacterium epidermidicanis]|uniref:Gluconokinase n=1 Tax=Corynebacterium epidermidicanis TaxID=1050174 RepID=A0A0G3GSL5_9CORY|nr:gluconokinase [Corynebacterium epidermidicanis]AKK04131.1 carbohydrate kinase, thermoresistant glucokinase family [Corynebacterium epidermidicanis]